MFSKVEPSGSGASRAVRLRTAGIWRGEEDRAGPSFAHKALEGDILRCSKLTVVDRKSVV